MTLEQLKEYNGTGPEGRVLVAVNGKIFDVTKGIKIHFTCCQQFCHLVSKCVTGSVMLSLKNEEIENT